MQLTLSEVLTLMAWSMSLGALMARLEEHPVLWAAWGFGLAFIVGALIRLKRRTAGEREREP